MKIISYPSINFNERAENTAISMIVIHATGVDLPTSLAILSGADNERNPSGRVSVHYLIAENGDIYQLVADENRAWHAGISQWKDKTDINSCSIGIELVNAHPQFQNDFTAKQMQSLSALIQHLKNKYPIQKDDIVGHEHIAPGRKADPGENFPWAWLDTQIS